MSTIPPLIPVVTLLSAIALPLRSQTLANQFDYTIREANGDLNNDGITDRATITMNTAHETWLLKFEVFLS